MDVYFGPIIWGILIFPFVAAIFTVPYILSQYHKYGSIPFLRVVIVYSFILYLLCSFFLVILPLPSLEDVAKLTTPTMQLHPFEFVTDFMVQTSLVVRDPSTYLKALTEPWFYQVVYNVLLFVPFGIYLRYYFKCSLLKTIVLSLLLSLFFELTQLSGLYGFYPRGYRLFDVDDLMINTIGGLVGFVIGGIFLKILPSRDELDLYAYKKGQKISVLRRIVNLFLDLFLYFVLTITLFMICKKSLIELAPYIPFISGFIYYILIPILLKGQTLGKKFLRMKLVNLQNEKPKVYQYIIRYVVLFFILFPLPLYLGYGSMYLIEFLNKDVIAAILAFLLIVLVLGAFLYYLITLVFIAKGKLIWYEKLSKTKNISTITGEDGLEKAEETVHKSEE